MNSKLVRLEYEDAVATITLDHPEKRNALSDGLLTELLAALQHVKTDEQVRCVVLTSSHDKIFSAGGDLTGFTNQRPLIEKYRSIDLFPQIFRAIGELGKPTICAANGHVLAGALGIALACDLIVAKQSARFGVPEINVGVFPFMVCALLYRNVPRKFATELLLLGEQISATEAHRIGIVNRVIDDAEFAAEVIAVSQQLAAKSPLLMALGKDAIYRQFDLPFEDSLDYLRSQLALAFSTDDIREGVGAFLEKREPRWTGQ